MIEKKIHYVWLGKGKYNDLMIKCINSWKEKLPDYDIIEWNEDNLDLKVIAKENKFFKECKKRKMWAFMADYLRLKILYENGGIYLDSDVEVLKSFNNLLNQPYIIGMETKEYVSSAVIGCEKNNELIGKILDFYNNRIWNEPLYTIPTIMTKVINEQNNVKIYKKEYFSPIEYEEKYNDDLITPNTYTIHWFNASWNTKLYVQNFLKIKHIKPTSKRIILKIKINLEYYINKILK